MGLMYGCIIVVHPAIDHILNTVLWFTTSLYSTVFPRIEAASE